MAVVIITNLAAKMKRKDLSKLSADEKRARKARQSNLRKKRWRKKLRELKLE